jgi:hypothetical protein
VHVATDKTRLTNFSGNKQAYPVYATVNLISKAVRRRPNSRAQVLVGYLPVPKLSGFKSDASAKRASHNLFHDCMSILVKPLIEPGMHGKDMTCADGWTRRIFPILACYIGDAPEQALVTCTKQNYCPKCRVLPDERGQRIRLEMDINFRDPDRTKEILRVVRTTGTRTPAFKAEGLQQVDHPFWENLPHCDIFSAITPDILHQLHQGLIGEHMLPWLVKIADTNSRDESDLRFQANTEHPGLRHFKDGFSKLSQRSGNENRQLEKAMLGVFAGGVPAAAQRAAQALLEVCYLARWEQHDTHSLDAMDRAIDTFHQNKHIFIDLGIREHFNFPKLHALEHYVHSIRSFGSADGYSTEISERLHIDFAKRAYLFTNRRDFTAQMTKWLVRREKLAAFEAYQDWLDRLESSRAHRAVPDSEEHTAQTSPDRAREERRVVGPHSTYEIAKQPPVRKVSILEITSNFHAPGFLAALSKFLSSHSPGTQVPEISPNQLFSLYKQFIILVPGNPQTGTLVQRERVRAVPELPGPTARTVTPEFFGVVLVRVNQHNANTDGTPYDRESIILSRSLQSS